MARKKTEKQRTLKSAIRYSGIALHTGVRAHIRLEPAPENTGIVVRRTDEEGEPEGIALATRVTDVQRATTISCGEKSHVKLVEHIVAALYGLGVDNAVLAMDGAEPPVADGSSKPYVELIQAVGTVEQKAARKYFVVKEPIWVKQGESQLVFLPSEEDEFRLTCTIHYGVCDLDTQYLSIPINEETFVNELSGARTFCEDYNVVASLMKAGLIRGASLDNAMVVRDGALVCKDGLRYSDEMVRHKMLDVVGDLSLIGRRIKGQLIAIRPGHPLNVTMAKKIVQMMGYDTEE